MAVPKFALALVGSWSGTSRLNYSFDPEKEVVYESESHLQVTTDPGETYISFDYSWSHEGEGKWGRLLVVEDAETEKLSASFVDSWHQGSSLMPLAGQGTSEAKLSLLGSFPVEGQPDWGWRIEISGESNSLLVAMNVIEPEAEDQWAVRAEYARVAE